MSTNGTPGAMFALDGRSALVTGSTRGIGYAIAEALAAHGARVLLHGREAVAPLPGWATGSIAADLSEAAGVARLVEEAADRLGAVDILINNAGINIPGTLATTTRRDLERILSVDLTACLLLAQAVAPAMIARGTGRIVNIASVMSLVSRAANPAYTAAKHAVAGLTKSLAAELGPLGVTVNAIAPGYVETGATASLHRDEAFNRKIIERTPVRRWGQPADIAGAAVYLSSDAAAFVNGHLLVVDGGLAVTVDV